MLVSHRKRFIYTKTAKTASTSVESYFERYCMPEGEWQFQHARESYESEAGIIGYRGANPEGKRWFHHMAAKEIRERLGNDIWDSYFKFTVVRNPFDLLVSNYFFAMREVADDEDPVSGFREWLKSGVANRHTYTIDGAFCLDYYIRYEQLEDGIRHVCTRIGVPFEPARLPRLKTGFRRHEIPLAHFYDPDSAALVHSRYAPELEHFGYELPVAGGRSS